jgi:hypothetical protein
MTSTDHDDLHKADLSQPHPELVTYQQNTWGRRPATVSVGRVGIAQAHLEQAVVGQFADRGGAVDHRRFR